MGAQAVDLPARTGRAAGDPSDGGPVASRTTPDPSGGPRADTSTGTPTAHGCGHDIGVLWRDNRSDLIYRCVACGAVLRNSEIILATGPHDG